MSNQNSNYLIVDGHQDLAWNILAFGRDYTRSAAETRRLELATDTPARNGDTLLGYPDYQHGRVALIFATLFAAPDRRKLGDWDFLCYPDDDIEAAHRLYSQQLDTYHQLINDHPDKFKLVSNRAELESLLELWVTAQGDNPLRTNDPPVGLLILMENAEAVRSPAELDLWWNRGIRIIGPAWAGTRYCGGTREPGPLTAEGYALLEGMAELGFILDLSHMDEEAVLQALDAYPGRIIASHANAQALLKGLDSNRHLTDRMLSGLLARDAVIGVVPANGFLLPGWKEQGGRETVTLEHVVAQIDYVCQAAGDANHAAIGSDFDGGFGLQSVPGTINSIADLQKLAPLLSAKGYRDEDVAAIFGGNWLSLLRESLP
jgi:membrane dipeptidase